MWVVGEEVYENDSEHSFQLAMTALFVIESESLELDVFRAMAMALVHDVLEVHSGDTPVFGSEESLSAKVALERRAVNQLRYDWPALTLMHELIAEYEGKQTPESRFVYALDKLIPIFNNYLDDGRNWKKNRVDLEDITRVKAGRIDADPIINGYYKELVAVLRNKPELFTVKDQ